VCRRFAWIKPGDGERLGANTFLGDYRLQQQREACALWPRATLPDNYSEPTKADAPVLILTGEWDPVTPPANGDAVARNLPNSLHVVVPHGRMVLAVAGDSSAFSVYSATLLSAGAQRAGHILP
jgi:pimeloyl-ACP methyl ester carboxylesterase